MNLDSSQSAAVEEEGSCAVTACPGSGKTRTLVAKLARCVEEVRGGTRMVAAITHTRAASWEVEGRVSKLLSSADERYFSVGTIHAFCLTKILSPHYPLLPELQDGFWLATPESDEYQVAVKELTERFSFQGSASNLRDSLERLTLGTDGTPRPAWPLTEEGATFFVEYLWGKGCIDFGSLLYFSYRILVDAPHVCAALAAKYAWFLIDEFQDTSDLQLAILKVLADERKSRFFIVGDPCQSIFRFAGARPENLHLFAEHVAARADIMLVGNHRCSKNIVDAAESLQPREPPMAARGPTAACSEPVQLVHVANAYEAVQGHFLPAAERLGIPLGECAVLSPWLGTLFPLGQRLVQDGVRVVGPGARPYRRRHLLAPFAELLAAHSREPMTTRRVRISHALNDIAVRLSGREVPDLFERRGRRMLEQVLLESDEQSVQLGGAGIPWLESLPQIVERAASHQGIDFRFGSALSTSAAEMVSEIGERGVRTSELTVSNFADYASPTDHLRLLTVHRSKGREFDAVAILDVHEGKFPHFKARTRDDVEDSRRALYVATTRARTLLLLFTWPGTGWRKNSPSRFIRQMGL